jgi:hypothetical protein
MNLGKLPQADLLNESETSLAAEQLEDDDRGGDETYVDQLSNKRSNTT